MLILLSTAGAQGRELLYVTHGEVDFVVVVDTASRTEITRVPLRSEAGAMVAAPDGRRVYVQERDNLAVIDTATNLVVARINLTSTPGTAQARAISAAGGSYSTLAAISNDGTRIFLAANLGLTVVDTVRGAVADVIPLSPGSPGVVSLTPDERQLYVGIDAAQSLVAIVDVATSRQVGEILIPNYSLTNILFTVDGRRAFMSFLDTLGAIDTVTQNLTISAPIEFTLGELLLSPDESALYVVRGALSDGDLLEVDPETLSVRSTLRVGNEPKGLALSSDHRNLFVANNRSDSVSVVDLDQFAVVDTIPVGIGPNGLAIAEVPPTPSPTPTGLPTATRRPGDGGGCAVVARRTCGLDWVIALGILLAACGRRLRTRTGRVARRMVLLILLSAAGAQGRELLYVTHGEVDFVVVVDTASRTEIARVPLRSEAGAMVAAPDGRRVYVQERDNLAVIDTATNMVVARISLTSPPGRAHARAASPASGAYAALAAISSDGARIYLAANLGLTVVDTIRGAVSEVIPLSQDYPQVVSLTPDERQLYVGIEALQNLVAIVDVATSEAAGDVPIPNFGLTNIVFTADGRHAFMSFLDTLGVIDTGTRTVTTSAPIDFTLGELLLSPDEATVYVVRGALRDGDLLKVDAQTLSVQSTLRVGNEPTGLALSSDHRTLFVTNNRSDSVSVVDLNQFAVVDTIPVGVGPFGLAMAEVPPTPSPTPTGLPTATRRPSDGGGCAVVAPRAGGVEWLLMLGLMLAARRRRLCQPSGRATCRVFEGANAAGAG